MMGKTSLLMFPIYGCASLIGPCFPKKYLRFLFFSGAVCIPQAFLLQNIPAALFLKHFHMCPLGLYGYALSL